MMWLSMTVGLFLAAPPTEADRLFAKGRELLKKRPVEACQLFEKSFHLDPALGALLNLALCQESIEHWASAWLNFNRAREWAARTHEGDREALAKKHVETLAPKLSWVAISAAQPAPGLETELDGQKAPMAGRGRWRWILDRTPSPPRRRAARAGGPASSPRPRGKASPSWCPSSSHSSRRSRSTRLLRLRRPSSRRPSSRLASRSSHLRLSPLRPRVRPRSSRWSEVRSWWRAGPSRWGGPSTSILARRVNGWVSRPRHWR